MKIQNRLREIKNINFNISNCYVLGQDRKGKNSVFSTIGSPRRIHGFLYLNNCSCTYTLADGTKRYAKRGDIVYLPPLLEYSSQFYDQSSEQPHVILINMLFTDEAGESFYLADSLKVFKVIDKASMQKLFFDAFKANNHPVKDMAQIKSNAYRLLSYLGTTDKNKNLVQGKYKCIIDGINYLENDTKQELSIEEIAKMCNVSSTYFRRLFKEYSGISPIQFRINKIISNAKELLADGNMNIVAISDYLGFDNVTYFSKMFKKCVGCTPKEYKNRLKKNI